MSSRNPRLPQCAVRCCGLLTGAFLAIATAAFVFWQNTHLTVLWDLSYILENSTRIAAGQIPYRDFPFPYAPLTFLVQAALIKLFGRVVLHHYFYAACAGAMASLLTWLILLRLLAASRLPARLIAFLLAAPLIFLGTNSIFPHPFYDSDCTLCILFCTWLLLRLESANFPPLATFACGILLAVPLFIKQNTGLAFFLSAALCIAYLGLHQRRAGLLLMAGGATGLVAAVALIQCTAGIANYLQWTVQFAASRRLPAFATMLGVYQGSAVWWSLLAFAAGLALFLLPIAHSAAGWIASALLSLPFLWALAALFLQQDDSDRVEALLHLWPVLLLASLALALWKLPGAQSVAQLLPLVLLAVIHGAFLSQQLWGSTYALWPLLMILIATILIALAPRQGSASLAGRASNQGPDHAGPDNAVLHNAADGNPRRATGDGPPGEAQPSIQPLTAFTAVASLVLLITGAYYALSHERLDYVDLSGETLAHSSLRPLRGLAMRGDWLAEFEQLVAFSNREIPPGDAILMLPGEDLFYFTTGRTPQFPVLLLDNTVNPYSAAQLAQLARQRNVAWVVVKRSLQLQEEPTPFRPQLLELLAHDFSPAASLDNYEIYRRNQP